MRRITRDIVSYYYEVADPPRLDVPPGETVIFETWDARAGALLDRPPGIPFELPRPTPGRGNPLTGPLAVRGAEPGDALVVRIDRIECLSPGWCGGHAHVGPFPEGRVPRPVGRVCAIEEGAIRYSDGVLLPVEPMVGCIGTAVPGDAPQAGIPGRHGGNLDHPVIAEGTTVMLPVFSKSALLYLGDVHATQGDGELSGVGVEIPAEVTVKVDLWKGALLRWPWAVTEDAVMVMTAHLEFERAREEAVEEMLQVLETQLGLEPGDAIALISVAGNLRIGQAFGAMEMTLRLEMPRSLGIVPA
ncbi:MAG: acetamidase/formamidase family protein [bacterium]|nr:acetamidase/formamidase family protein [bacterium]MDE0352399.1 acetamidase/formamidase family protein [bacterium]